jgi:GAF domain-containing protein
MSEPPPQRRQVADVANALSLALAPIGDDLVDWTARTARAVFGAAACSIALLTEDGSELVFTTASGGAANSVSGLRLPAGEGIAGWVATTGQPLAVNDLSGDARFAANVASSTGYMPRAILASPIETDERLIGVIEILDRDAARAGSDDDLALLALFARQAALALDASARARRIGDLVVAVLDAVERDGPGADLAEALRSAASDVADAPMGELAAAFADLAAAGPRERALGVSVLSAVAGYVRERRR